MADEKNYKDTLLMPKTDFEMRGNLPKKEPLLEVVFKPCPIAILP